MVEVHAVTVEGDDAGVEGDLCPTVVDDHLRRPQRASDSG